MYFKYLGGSVACKAAFANRLLKSADSHLGPDNPAANSASPVDRLDICRRVYQSIWTGFEFESKTTVAQLNLPPTGQNKLSDDERRKAYKDTLLDGNDLADLVNNTFTLQVATEYDVNCHLINAINSADSATFLYTLLPFVKTILEQKVEVYRLDQEGKASPASIKVVTLILKEYIAGFVGLEPRAPSNWTLPTRGCRSRCSDCAAVNRFLRNPTEKVGRFPIGKSRRHHLHQYFNNASNVEYTIQTLRHTEPETWQITKHRKEYEDRRRAWEGKRKDAEKRINSLGEAGLLKSYLDRDWVPLGYFGFSPCYRAYGARNRCHAESITTTGHES